jgi:5'-nucleotidase
MPNKEPQILLTNDDGIDSPGLWAAAEALSNIGYVWVAAPRDQASGTGRSMPLTSDGIITPQELTVHGKTWTVYAVGGTPAQTVEHTIMEIMDSKPDLVVSGINYGYNVGPGITISGTVGAALEGAAYGIPAIAISLETDKKYHFSHSPKIDFKTAAYFTEYFARQYLKGSLNPKAQLLKIDIPADASQDTPWNITRLSPVRFYVPQQPEKRPWEKPFTIDYETEKNLEMFPEDSDVYTIMKKRHISVTPLTLDMTASVDFKELDKQLRG